jgi:hypothetical protein
VEVVGIRSNMFKKKSIRKVELQKARITGIEYTESIFASSNCQKGLCLSIDYDCWAKVLWPPLQVDGRNVACGIHVN